MSETSPTGPLKCPPQGRIAAFARGELVEPSDVIEEHVQSCDQCRSYIDQIDREQRASDRTFTDGIDPRLSPVLGELEYREAFTKIRQMVGASEIDSEIGPGDPSTDASLPPSWLDEQAIDSAISLGDYQLLQPIGRGGIGIVFRARSHRDDQDVAIKILQSRLICDERVQRRFEQEIQAINSLEHPNIVASIDSNEYKGIHYLVMEFVDGLNFAEFVSKRGCPSHTHVTQWMKSVAEGLQHIHQAGMVHRDIKPGNLMIAETGEVKIMDLGLAMLSEAHGRLPGQGITSSNQVMGTLDFIAPEQANDMRNVDARADLYSLGATFYFLISGQPPIGAPTGSGLFERLSVLQTRRPRPLHQVAPDCPVHLSRVIHRLLLKNPKHRYQNVEQLLTALETKQSGLGLAGLKSKDAIWSWSRGTVGKSIAALVVLFLFCSVAAGIWLKGNSISFSPNSRGIVGEHADSIPKMTFASEREAVTWVLQNNGSPAVYVRDSIDDFRSIKSIEQIPSEPYDIIEIYFYGDASPSSEALVALTHAAPLLKTLHLPLHRRLDRSHLDAIDDSLLLEYVVLGSRTPSNVADKELSALFRKLPQLRAVTVYQLGIDGSCFDDIVDPNLVTTIGVGMPFGELPESQHPRLTSQWLGNLNRFPNLRSLNLMRHPLADETIEALEGLDHVQELYLNNGLEMPRHLPRLVAMPHLVTLDVGHPEVNDDHLPILAKAKSLRRIGLEGAGLSTEGIEELRQLLPKCTIEFGGTEIPPWEDEKL